jgi:hypothetical protein
MRVTSRALFLVVLLMGVAHGGVASAQPSTSEKESARNLMDEGDRRRNAGDLRGALKAYSDADGIMGVPTTTIEVARTEAALGQLLEAREAITRLLRFPSKPNEPAVFGSARRAAEALATEIAARLPTIQVSATADPGQHADVDIDGEPIAASAPRKVNPGSHVIAVRVGTAQHSETVTLVERETKMMLVDMRTTRKQPVAETRAIASPRHSSLAVGLLYGGYGVGAAGLLVGSITGILSISKTNSLKDRCPSNACPVGSQSDIDTAQSLGNVSTVGFVIAGIGAAVGTVGLVMVLGEKKQEDRAALKAYVGPGSAGFAGAF